MGSVRTQGFLQSDVVFVSGGSLCGACQEVNRRLCFSFATWTHGEDLFFGFRDLILFPAQGLDVVYEFHMLEFGLGSERSEIETECVPVDPACCFGVPFVSLANIFLQDCSIYMETDGCFDFSRKSVSVDGDGYLGWVEMLELGARFSSCLPVVCSELVGFYVELGVSR